MASETLISHFKPSSSPLNSSKLSVPSPPHPDHPDRSQSMFSSLPTTAKSSNWLQRLRSSRGFPESDHIDLEHFLSTSRDEITPTDSSSVHKTPLPEEKRVNGKCEATGAVHQRDLIKNVLSELFYVGEIDDKSRIKTKKSSRKQQCPRICVVSTELDARKQQCSFTCSPASLPLTSSSRHKVKEINQVMERVENEDEKVRFDFSGYSQTEVTVIDTSVPCWKFEKMLYRCKNVWKVGDRKGKGLMSSDRKKRKERLNENSGDLQKKKLKKKKKMKLCSSLKDVGKEEAMILSNSRQGNDQAKMMVLASEKKRDNCGQVQEKSFCKKQIDGSSSVILIKSIPTSKKNLSGASSSCLKSVQR